MTTNTTTEAFTAILTAITAILTALAALLGALRRLGLCWPRRSARPRRRAPAIRSPRRPLLH